VGVLLFLPFAWLCGSSAKTIEQKPHAVVSSGGDVPISHDSRLDKFCIGGEVGADAGCLAGLAFAFSKMAVAEPFYISSSVTQNWATIRFPVIQFSLSHRFGDQRGNHGGLPRLSSKAAGKN